MLSSSCQLCRDDLPLELIMVEVFFKSELREVRLLSMRLSGCKAMVEKLKPPIGRHQFTVTVNYFDSSASTHQHRNRMKFVKATDG